MTIEDFYDDLPFYTKESADMPLSFSDMPIDKQIFFRDLFDQIEYDKEVKNKELIEDLNLIKSDLEAVIADIKK